MSTPLPDALRARLQRCIEEGLTVCLETTAIDAKVQLLAKDTALVRRLTSIPWGWSNRQHAALEQFDGSAKDALAQTEDEEHETLTRSLSL